jgi:hypothetical protein
MVLYGTVAVLLTFVSAVKTPKGASQLSLTYEYFRPPYSLFPRAGEYKSSQFTLLPLIKQTRTSDYFESTHPYTNQATFCPICTFPVLSFTRFLCWVSPKLDLWTFVGSPIVAHTKIQTGTNFALVSIVLYTSNDRWHLAHGLLWQWP